MNADDDKRNQGADLVEDDIEDVVAVAKEKELTFGPQSVLAVFSPMAATGAAEPKIYKERTSCDGGLGSWTIAPPSSKRTRCGKRPRFWFPASSCSSDRNRGVSLMPLVRILETFKQSGVGSNLIIALGGSTVCFSTRTRISCTSVCTRQSAARKNTLVVLRHLVWNDPIKVKGQLGEMAQCLSDNTADETPRPRILRIVTKEKAICNNLSYLALIVEFLSGLGGHAFQVSMKLILKFFDKHKRGRYLAVWLFFKNSGTILAGAINLGTNIHRSTGGKVNYKTLLAFIALQVLALPFAFLISKPERVQRDDRTPVPLPPKTTVKEQLKELWKACSTQKVGVLLPIFFASWYYWGYSSSFLTLYFSVRARALASFLSAIYGVFATTLLGFFLDSQRLSIAARARIGAAATFPLFSGILIWAIVVQHQFTEHNPGKLDWTDKTGQFGKGFGLYVMLNAAGNCVQNYLYWLISVLAEDLGVSARYAGLLRGVESFGQCAAFGVNSSRFNLTYTVVIIIVFWAVSLPSSFITILKVGIAEGYGGPSAAVAGDVEKRSSEIGDNSSDLDDEKRESEEEAKPAVV